MRLVCISILLSFKQRLQVKEDGDVHADVTVYRTVCFWTIVDYVILCILVDDHKH